MGAQEFKVSRARVRRALENGGIVPYTFEAERQTEEDAALCVRGGASLITANDPRPLMAYLAAHADDPD